eukprot:723241-Pleurochrysis_carterae.AAC.3
MVGVLSITSWPKGKRSLEEIPIAAFGVCAPNAANGSLRRSRMELCVAPGGAAAANEGLTSLLALPLPLSLSRSRCSALSSVRPEDRPQSGMGQFRKPARSH